MSDELIMPRDAILPDQLVEDKSLAEAIAKFVAEREAKSFSGRHPELGKMVNCPICLHRHRVSHTCIAVYVKLADSYGRPKGRIKRHPNKRALQLIQRTQELYPKYSVRLKPINAMKCARAEAGRTLRAERKADRRWRKLISQK